MQRERERGQRGLCPALGTASTRVMNSGVGEGREECGTGIFWTFAGSGYPGKPLQGSQVVLKYVRPQDLKVKGILFVISSQISPPCKI